VFWRDGRHDIAHGPKSRVARDLMTLVAQRLEPGA
jgi:phosphopantothenoylcysteine decarboxylase/phosphopantothenate--cysteine ligase